MLCSYSAQLPAHCPISINVKQEKLRYIKQCPVVHSLCRCQYLFQPKLSLTYCWFSKMNLSIHLSSHFRPNVFTDMGRAGSETVQYLHQTKRKQTNKQSPQRTLFSSLWAFLVCTHSLVLFNIYIFIYALYMCVCALMCVCVYLVTTICIFWRTLEAFSCLNLREWPQA